MNKEILRGAFTQTNIFAYKCPQCHNGELRLLGEFNSQETEMSKIQHGEDWWSHDDVALIFNCTLKCSTCSELVFMVGNGIVDIDHDIDEDGEWVSSWVSFYSPTFFHPPLKLIEYAANSPQDVITPLSVASSLYFASPASCCNNVRAAAELILTKLGVPDKDPKDDKFISFGHRISLIPEEQKSTKELFSAIRWIGNHGSHPGDEIDFEDALHALEIMEFLLEEIYGTKRKQLKELADAINDRKGPISRLEKLRIG